MALSQGFQSQVSTVPAPGVEGDFSTLNPFYLYPAGPGGLVAGTSMIGGVLVAGAVVGRWAWAANTFVDTDGASSVVNCFGTGAPLGLVPRRLQGFITTWLNESSLIVPTGLALGVMSAADMWVINRGSTQAQIGQFALANFADGSTSFGSAVATGATSTGSTVAAENFSVTGSVSGNVLTVTAVGSGTVYPGSTISGSNITSGSMVVQQLSGTTGGVGTYSLNYGEQAAVSTTVSGTYGLLTLGTVTSGPFAVGDVISGGSVVAGTVITASITGGGSSGTMVVNNNTVVSSAAIVVAAVNYLTGWKVATPGLPGDPVKIFRLP